MIIRKNICIPGPIEILRLRWLKYKSKLIDISNFASHLSSLDLYCFATGKSIIDLNKILIKNNQHLNTFIFSTGLVKYVDYFGVLPKRGLFITKTLF